MSNATITPVGSILTKNYLDLLLAGDRQATRQTVERAVASACQLGVKYLTVHAGGGPGMLRAAAAAAARPWGRTSDTAARPVP